MSDPSTGEVAALIASARADFAARLPSKVIDLRALVQDGAWREVRRAAHRLRGSAATYGFGTLGAAVGLVEDLLVGGSDVPSAAVGARIERILDEARAALAANEAP